MAGLGDVLLFSPIFDFGRRSSLVQSVMENVTRSNGEAREIQWWPRLGSKRLCQSKYLRNLADEWASQSSNSLASGFVCDHDVCGGSCETVVLPTLHAMDIQVMVIGDIQKMAPLGATVEGTNFTYGAGEIYDIDNDNYYYHENSCMGCKSRANRED